MSRVLWSSLVVSTLLLPVAWATSGEGAGATGSGPVDGPPDAVDTTASETGEHFSGSELDVSNDPAIDPAVLSLVEDYGISVEQAIRQMETQSNAALAEAALPPDLVSSYGGREIRHDHGGEVRIGLSNPVDGDKMAQHFKDYGVVDAVVVDVRLNNAQLDARVVALQTVLDKSASRSLPFVDVGRQELGKVTVRVAAGTLSPEEARVVADARADPGLYTVVSVDHIETAIDMVDDCDRTGDIECSPPLRGSIQTRQALSGSTITICTAGFNAKSKTDAKPYVLTAGHCDNETGNTVYAKFEDGSAHNIGIYWGAPVNNSTGDYAIVNVTNPTGWQTGENWITVNPSQGMTAQDRYTITGVANVGMNDRVCLTGGNFPATSCASVDDTLDPQGGHNNLFRTTASICVIGGDSGGPIFSYHIAYGLLSQGSPSGATCGGRIWGQPVIAAANGKNVSVLTS